ncbi:hypothetical protein JHK84_040345 [Glycine max]|nr:hypothetical protein JHK84_040345 [Glycine max]
MRRKVEKAKVDHDQLEARGYIQMEEVSKFRNKVRQAGQKRDKREESTKIDLHKSDKRHKLDKHQPLPKGLWYERYTLLTSNHTTILEEAFNLEVLIRLPPTKPPRLGLDVVLVITQKIVGP